MLHNPINDNNIMLAVKSKVKLEGYVKRDWNLNQT